MIEYKNMTAHEFNNKVFTVAELKNLLNNFNNSDKVDFLLYADATWNGAEGELSVYVNDKEIITIDL